MLTIFWKEADASPLKHRIKAGSTAISVAMLLAGCEKQSPIERTTTITKPLPLETEYWDTERVLHTLLHNPPTSRIQIDFPERKIRMTPRNTVTMDIGFDEFFYLVWQDVLRESARQLDTIGKEEFLEKPPETWGNEIREKIQGIAGGELLWLVPASITLEIRKVGIVSGGDLIETPLHEPIKYISTVSYVFEIGCTLMENNRSYPQNMRFYVTSQKYPLR